MSFELKERENDELKLEKPENTRIVVRHNNLVSGHGNVVDLCRHPRGKRPRPPEIASPRAREETK